MGRFTSVQGFADNNSNNRSITYDQAKGTSGAVNSGSGKNERLVTEKVVNPYGSTSGAGSGEFHVYRHARSREMARWNALDREAKQEEEERKFRATLEDDQKQLETKASKNRRKRQREKEAKRRKKCMKAAGIDLQAKSTTKNDDNKRKGEGGEEEFTYIPVAQQQQERDKDTENCSKKALSPARNDDSSKNNVGNVAIPNDGSFLEMMTRKLQEGNKQRQQQPNPTDKTKDNRKNDKKDELGASSGREKVIDDNINKNKGNYGESDDECPALPPTLSKA